MILIPSWNDVIGPLFDISFVLVCLLASLALFSVGIMRYLVRVRLGKLRKFLTLSVLVACLSGSIYYVHISYRWMGLWGWVAPVFVLMLVGIIEILERDRLQVLTSEELHAEARRWQLLHPVTTHDLRVRRHLVRLPGWRGPGVRVAHLTDFHITDRMPLAYYRAVVQCTMAEKPDLILVTGDFITYERFVPLLPEALAGLQAPLGIYAILGNHDAIKAAEAVKQAMSPLGVCFIGGSSLRVDGHPTLCLAGDETPWGDQLVVESRRPESGELLVTLTHTPDNIYRLTRNGLGQQVVFAGHFHGGQVRLPGFGAVVVPSVYGRRFVRGHFMVNHAHMFVSSGVGAAVPPLRLYCPPEILIVNLMPNQ